MTPRNCTKREKNQMEKSDRSFHPDVKMQAVSPATATLMGFDYGWSCRARNRQTGQNSGLSGGRKKPERHRLQEKGIGYAAGKYDAVFVGLDFRSNHRVMAMSVVIRET